MRLLKPLGVEAAFDRASRARTAERPTSGGRSNWRSSRPVTKQRSARRQYDAVDPDNRLVAGELERRWNERLTGSTRLEEPSSRRSRPPAPRLKRLRERERLMRLGADLEQRLVASWRPPTRRRSASFGH